MGPIKELLKTIREEGQLSPTSDEQLKNLETG
jgi:hypothetical protein